MNLKQLLLGRSYSQYTGILIIISKSCVNQLDEVKIKIVPRIYFESGLIISFTSVVGPEWTRTPSWIGSMISQNGHNSVRLQRNKK